MERKIVREGRVVLDVRALPDKNDSGAAEEMPPLPDLGPIERVREGMRVIDAAGEKIGTVGFVRMGDPDATTVGADAPGDGGLFANIAGVFGFEGEPEVPAPLQARLLRKGFIKVDGKGLTDPDRYVAADKIDGVSVDTVRLNVVKDQMAEER